MAQRWYEKATVQAAIVLGLFGLVGICVAPFVPSRCGERVPANAPSSSVAVAPLPEPSPLANLNAEDGGPVVQVSPQPVSTMTLREYCDSVRALSDRNFERNDFVKKMRGASVTWEGVVEKVGESFLSPEMMSLTTGVDDSGFGCAAFYTFSTSWGVRLYALHNGDRVRVRATFRSAHVPTLVQLDGHELDIVQQASSSPTASPQ